MQVFDIKSKFPPLASEIIKNKNQILDNHRLSKEILFRSSESITSYFSFYQPLVAEKNENMTSFNLLCHQLEQQKVFELTIIGIQYPLKKLLLLVEALKKNKSLKILNLTSNKIRCQILAQLYLSLKQMPLEELTIKGNRLTDSSIFRLENALKQNKSLRVIDFTSNKIGNQELKALCSIFENQPLETLNLSSNQICSIFPLIKALKNNRTLKVLDLSDNQIKDEGLAILSPVFKNMPLETLDFGFNQIENIPLKFCSFLKNSSIKTLHLGRILTRKSIKTIALALKDNVHIKHLSGLAEDKEFIYTFYPLMDLLISLGHKLSTKKKEKKNYLRIPTDEFSKSMENFYALIGYKFSTKNLKKPLYISTKNFPRSLRALNNAFDSHIPIVDLVDIISSYTFSIDTLSTLVES